MILTTLAGPNSDLTDLYATIPWGLDAWIILYSHDIPLFRGEPITEAKGLSKFQRLIVEHRPWTDSFAEARQAILERAAREGVGWVFNLDADQRLVQSTDVWKHTDVGLPSGDVGLIQDVSEAFSTPALIHTRALAKGGKWIGRSAEYFSIAGEPCLSDARIAELPKTGDEIAAKARRGIANMLLQIKDDPTSVRWPFYMGEYHRTIGEHDAALEAYEQAAELARLNPSAWNLEQGAWALFKGARGMFECDRPEDAFNVCVRAQDLCPWLPEPAWFAAWVALQNKQWARAFSMAHDAITARCDPRAKKRRLSWREEPAHGTGPEEIIRAALDGSNYPNG